MKVIMNPPYSGNLHLKILREAMQHSDDIVNLSPASQLFAPKRLIRKHPIVSKYPELIEHISDVNLIKSYEASILFGTAFASDLMLIHYNKNVKGVNVDDFNMIPLNLRSIFDKTVRAIYNRKYKSLTEMIDFYNEHPDKSKIWLTTPEVHGNQGKSDFYEITSSRYEVAIEAKQRFGWHLEFDCEEHRRNCWEAWHLKSHQFIHSLIKWDNFNMYEGLPYLDYTHKWTDADLYAYFGLTADEIDIIEKEMAKYTK